MCNYVMQKMVVIDMKPLLTFYWTKPDVTIFINQLR